jgi:hypothetical protein
MFTEIIQELIAFIKRNTCWHKYKVVIRKDNGADFWVCEKCEHIKIF